MCGICGFNWGDEVLARKIAELLKHRGPDADGIYNDRYVSLGHKRLAIIDLSKKGVQPMSNEDGSVWITFNGEIFNFEAIREDLESKGHKFRSKSDTEVIVHGYEEYGTDILQKLNGQFAFCIYDRDKRELFLARDRPGINPLYYSARGEKFIFASEMKAVIAAGVDKEIDTKSLEHYILFGYTPKHRTIFRDVKKLDPGSYLIYDLKKKEVKANRRYWKVNVKDMITDEKKAAKLIRSTLERSVRRRMIADVPVGAFLSGGLDSSAIVAFASRFTSDLNTFSIKFDKAGFDESKYAEKVSKLFGTNHHSITFTAEDVRNLISKISYHYDEPFGDHSMIPTFLVSQVARKHVKVSLSGDAGDELFGGYDKYKNLLALQKVRFLGTLGGKLASVFRRPLKLHRFLLHSALPVHQQFASLDTYKYIEDMDEDDFRLFDSYEEYFTFKDPLSNAINADFHSYLPEDILVKVDRASLGNSLESRPPFLDHEMIQLGLSIHPELKIKDGETKYILKEAMKGILPDEIIFRKKKGFESPIREYFRKELKGLVQEKAIDYDKHDHFKKLPLERIWKSHLAGKKDYSRMLWTVLMFNLWWDRWMD